MPVPTPGAGSAGTPSDRLAASIRRMASGTEVLAASGVIYVEEEDGTTTELYPDPVPDEGDTDDVSGDVQTLIAQGGDSQSVGVSSA